MLNYISHNITRSSSPEMFRLMQDMVGFVEKFKENLPELAPYLALGLIDGMEGHMLQMADTDNPNEKGAMSVKSIDAMVYQLHLKSQPLQAFLNLAVKEGVFKEEGKEDGEKYVWSPDVERCLREWRKGRDARIRGGRNSHRSKIETDGSVSPLSHNEMLEYRRLLDQSKKYSLSSEETVRYNELAQRGIQSGQIGGSSS